MSCNSSLLEWHVMYFWLSFLRYIQLCVSLNSRDMYCISSTPSTHKVHLHWWITHWYDAHHSFKCVTGCVFLPFSRDMPRISSTLSTHKVHHHWWIRVSYDAHHSFKCVTRLRDICVMTHFGDFKSVFRPTRPVCILTIYTLQTPPTSYQYTHYKNSPLHPTLHSLFSITTLKSVWTPLFPSPSHAFFSLY